MASRKLKLYQEAAMLRLELTKSGSIPISTIEAELGSVSMRHALPPAGGLFSVECLTVGGPSVSELGGMYVPSHKRSEVLSDLKQMGYAIEE